MMKNLTEYIAESKALHQNVNITECISEKLIVNQRFDEKLIINKNYNPYQYYPKTWDELRQIVEERYEKLGPGTEQEPIDFNDIDVSGMTTFYNTSTRQGIFERTLFEYIDISDWDVSNIENMRGMFNYCYDLKYVGDLSNWDVSQVENMSFMFNWCENLIFVGDLFNWNILNVEDMSLMFKECENLKSVGDLNKWDISNVKYMKHMFYNSGITNIPKWYKG